MRVAVVGATGAVGSTMLGVLRERSFPAEEVVPFASERSAGRKIDWGDSQLTCVPLGDETIQGFDIALFSAGSGVSAEWAPRFADAGAVVVDNSSQWRMHEDVPLVVSEVNPDALESHRGIVANPNCTTMQTVVALGPILREASVAITHCGHGTVMKALAHGVPMVCIPMGRDQNDTAARIVHHGAGVRLSPRSSATRIAAAAREVLDDPRFRENAQRMSRAIAEEARTTDVVAELEAVVNRNGTTATALESR